MAIITFWGHTEKQTNQTTSILVSALQMGIERNLKILLVDGSFNSKAIRNAFSSGTKRSWLSRATNYNVMDVSSGLEGLLTAATSSSVSPEIIRSYSTPILTDRLDVLYGSTTIDRIAFDNSLAKFKDLLKLADQYYDLIFLDLQKGEMTDNLMDILKGSDLIVYAFEQKLEQIEEFARVWGNEEPFEDKNKVIPLITREDAFSKYNCDNVARKLKIRPGMCSIVYNTLLMEAVQEGKLIQLFFTLNNDEASYRNNYFLRTIIDLNALILDRLEQFKYRR